MSASARSGAAHLERHMLGRNRPIVSGTGQEPHVGVLEVSGRVGTPGRQVSIVHIRSMKTEIARILDQSCTLD